MIKRLVGETGFWYFPLALIARLPFAMMVVGVLTAVVALRGSVLLGGLNSALVGAGTAIFGPIIGMLADRFGQRRVLIFASLLNASALAVFVAITASALPDWAMLVSAFVVGATAPQTSSMSRSRLITVVSTKIAPAQRDRTLNAVMAYESTVDEIVFVFGPFIVGVFAVAFGAGAPVLAAAMLTLVFVLAFALHRTARPSAAQQSAELEQAPAAELLKPALLTVIAGIFGMGLFFGSMLTSLTAFMQSIGAAERTGILYGVMGLGSAILALSVAFFSPKFTKRARWLVFAVLMLVGGIVLQTVETEVGALWALAIIGLGIGPILVTQYSFGADRSPLGRGATVMTILGSAIVVGQSISAALTGLVSESVSADAAFVMPLIAVIWVLITGVANWFITPGGAEISARSSTV